MKSIDEYINNYEVKYFNMTDFPSVFYLFIYNKYDIVTFHGSLNLNPGDNILITRDILSDIRIDAPIYYVIDGIEYPITDKTRLITCLSTLKPIILRNKTNTIQSILFKRWIMKPEIIENLYMQDILEDNIRYLYGESNSDI